MLKVIVKNIITGKKHCMDMPLTVAETYKNLKVGQTVQYYDGKDATWEACKIEKLVDGRPKEVIYNPYPYTALYAQRDKADPLYYAWNPFWFGRRAGRATLSKAPLEWMKQRHKESKEKKEYQKKPYFLARLDTIEGNPDGKENLEKMMFPCYVIFRMDKEGKDKVGQLVTGNPPPHIQTEYQLIDMSYQVDVNSCCTIGRSHDLKWLMDKYFIEVVKGEAQLQKVGKVNV